jgi:hypothetical protein
MSTILQLVQDMSNRMIAYERKGITSNFSHVSFPSSNYNIINQLASIKVDASFLDMVTVSEQQQHLKNYMEGKNSLVASISEELGEDEPHANRIGVNNFRNLAKNHPFYIYVKNYG